MFNRHAGPTPGWPSDPLKINIDDGLVIKKNKLDPVFISQNYISEKEIIDIYAKSLNRLKIYSR